MEEITERDFYDRKYPIMSVNIDSQGIKYYKEDK